MLGYDSKGEMELVVTVTSQRVENVSSGALGVNSNDRRSLIDVAQDQSERSLRSRVCGPQHRFEGEHAKAGPASWEVYCSDLSDLIQTTSTGVSGRGPASLHEGRATKLIEDMVCEDRQWTRKRSVHRLHGREQVRVPRDPGFCGAGGNSHANAYGCLEYK